MTDDRPNKLTHLIIRQNDVLRALCDRVIGLALVNIALMARLTDGEERDAIRADALEALEALGSDARTAAPIIETLTRAPVSALGDVDDALAVLTTMTGRLQ